MMVDMSDEFDTTETEFDAMFELAEPVEIVGPTAPVGALFDPGRLTAVCSHSSSSYVQPFAQIPATAAAL